MMIAELRLNIVIRRMVIMTYGLYSKIRYFKFSFSFLFGPETGSKAGCFINQLGGNGAHVTRQIEGIPNRLIFILFVRGEDKPNETSSLL